MKRNIPSLLIGVVLPVVWLAAGSAGLLPAHHFYATALGWKGAEKTRTGVSPVLLLEIDNAALDEVGGWPWPAERTFQLLTQLDAWGAREAVLDASLFADGATRLPPATWAALPGGLRVVQPLVAGGDAACPEGGPRAGATLPSLPGLASAAGLPCDSTLAAGLDTLRDPSGSLVYPLAWARSGRVVPSLPLAALLVSQGVAPGSEGWWDPAGSSVVLPQGRLPLQGDGAMLLRPLGPPGSSVGRVSASAVLSGKVDPAQFRGRIVVVGATATGLSPSLKIPFSAPLVGDRMSRPEVTANVLAGLIEHRYARVTHLAPWLAWLLFVAAGGLALLALRLDRRWIGLVAVPGGTALAVVGTAFGLSDLQLWVNPVPAVVVGVCLLAGLLLWRRPPVSTEIVPTDRPTRGGLRTHEPTGVFQVPPPLADRPSTVTMPVRTVEEVSSVYQIARNDDGRLVRGDTGEIVQLGRYQNLRPLAAGGMCKVYEAHDPLMDRRVAIKILRSDKTRSNTTEQRFLREAKVAGSLNHPNINTVFDFGQVEDILYLVLEFVDGQTLSQWIRENNGVRPRAIAPWIRQIGDALDAAHRAQVTHRDVKPSNFMVVRATGAVKLMDFGVARTPDISLTQAGTTVGTPNYMSPEQLQGSKVGPSSDLYSFGVVVYQMLAQRLPFHGEGLTALCGNIVKGHSTRLSVHRPDLAGPVEEAVHKAFSVHPEDRFATGAEFSAAFEKACGL